MADPGPRYHVELKAFPHVARAFNLDRVSLDDRFVGPWAAGEVIDYDDRRWAPDRTKLTVLEGAEVDAAERGLGRGWGAVTRHGRDVTDEVIEGARRGADARPALEELKAQIVRAVAERDRVLELGEVVELAAAGEPRWRASEQLGLAEQAVWELLHQEGVALVDGEGTTIPAEEWQGVVLSWTAWAGRGAASRAGNATSFALRAAGGGASSGAPRASW